jgi:hypothetical protein
LPDLKRSFFLNKIKQARYQFSCFLRVLIENIFIEYIPESGILIQIFDIGKFGLFMFTGGQKLQFCMLLGWISQNNYKI